MNGTYRMQARKCQNRPHPAAQLPRGTRVRGYTWGFEKAQNVEDVLHQYRSDGLDWMRVGICMRDAEGHYVLDADRQPVLTLPRAGIVLSRGMASLAAWQPGASSSAPMSPPPRASSNAPTPPPPLSRPRENEPPIHNMGACSKARGGPQCLETIRAQSWATVLRCPESSPGKELRNSRSVVQRPAHRRTL